MAPSAIPAELRALPQWVRWKLVPDEPKPRKIPVRPSDPGCASSTDPATWGTFDVALSNVGQHGTCGVGFVFTKEAGLVGIDLDDCLTEEGTPDAKAAGIIAGFATCTEISPSGTGVHLIGRGSLNGHRGMNRKGVEVYGEGRYFAMTGNALPGTSRTVDDCQAALDALVAKLDPPRPVPPPPSPRTRRPDDHERLVERARAYTAKMPAAISGRGGHEATFRVALALAKGFSLDTGTALDVLREYNARCEPPWNEKELIHKIEDAGQADVPDGYIIERDEPRSPRTADRSQVDPEAPPSPWIDLERFREELCQVTRTRIPTRIPTLDRATEGGTSGGQVVLLNGPPGSVKSAFAIWQATYRGRVLGRRAYVYAPDQGGAQPLKRLASTFGNVAEDDDAFARFKLAADILRVIDERLDGVTIESFRDLVLTAGDVAAVVIDTPQTVATAENTEERQRIEKSMGVAREIAEKLLVPVYVCSHANRAATAARNKENRTLERSAGLGGAALEHRAQIVLFMERRDGQDRTEIDVLVTKAPLSGLRFRLLLDVEEWTLREIDIADTSEATAERAATIRTEKHNAARGERRAAIMAVVLGGPPDAGVSASRIREALGGKTEGLKPTLDVMVEEGLLETLDGPKPKRGGPRPVHYRIKQAAEPPSEAAE